MNTTPRIALFTCLAIAPFMAACSADEPTASQAAQAQQQGTDAPRTALGRTVENALREAREEMATGNIGVGGDMDIHVGGTNVTRKSPRDADGNPLPKAEISPAGDLLIDGRTVAVTDEQRALLLDYRGHVVDMIEAGMTIGVKGADLGMQAAGEALKNVFTGGGKDFEQRIEAEAALIEAEAMKLCDSLPAMLRTQDQLAASLPEFRPYATMEASDVEDCRNGSNDKLQHAGVREDIRGSIREVVQSAVAGRAPAADDTEAELDAAAAAEAASQ